MDPAARILILYHIIYQKKYRPKLRLLTGENNLLQRLRDLEQLQKFPPSQKAIEDYKKIDQFLTKSRLQANPKIRNLCITKIQSFRKVKFAQLRVQQCDLIIKRKETDTNIKLKTVIKLAKIIGRRWWLHLDPTTLLHLKTTNK